MTYQEKLQSVSTLITNYNKEINPEDKPSVNGFNTINPDTFINRIKFLGATDEEKLNALSYEDILECLPTLQVDSSGPPLKPRILCKEIAKIFRVKDKDEPKANPEAEVSKKVNNMSLRQLIESLDPEDLDSKVAKRLENISKGQAFLVYTTGKNIDADVSAKLLSEIKQGYPERKTFTVNGLPKPVHRLGDVPDNFADENPLYPGRMLRPDGTCDQTGRSWAGVPLEVKQLLNLALRDIDLTFETAHNLIDLAIGADPFQRIGNRYQSAFLRFEEMKKRNALPSLIVLLSKPTPGHAGSGLQHGKKIVWR